MGRANVGRLFYVAVFLTAGFILYQHHSRQHYDILLAQSSRDQYERRYQTLVAQEGQWRQMLVLEQLRTAALSEQLQGLKASCSASTAPGALRDSPGEAGLGAARRQWRLVNKTEEG